MVAEDINSISVLPIIEDEDAGIYEVSFEAGDGLSNIWMSAINDNGWKINAVTDDYGTELGLTDETISIPLLGLNHEYSASIEKRDDAITYRFIVPTSGKLYLQWLSGAENSSRSLYSSYLFSAKDISEPITSYKFQSSIELQQTTPLYVTSGVYFITIEARTNDNIPYHLSICLEQNEYVESENNDSIELANDIKTDLNYSGSLSSADDIDFYSFQLDEPAAIRLEISSPDGNKDEQYNVSITGSEPDHLIAEYLLSGNDEAEIVKVFLSSGKYYLKISAGSDWKGNAYTVAACSVEEHQSEHEENDTSDKSTVIEANESAFGSITKDGDIDWYSIILEGNNIVYPTMEYPLIDSGSKIYAVTVYSENGTKLQTYNFAGNNSSTLDAPLLLAAGTYYIRLENKKYVQQEYSLTFNCNSVENIEVEPNDDVSTATILQDGVSIVGNVMTEEDIDYYLIDVKAESDAVLNLSSDFSNYDDASIMAILESNGRKTDLAVIDDSAKESSVKLHVLPGTYALFITTGEKWSGDPYTISIIFQ